MTKLVAAFVAAIGAGFLCAALVIAFGTASAQEAGAPTCGPLISWSGSVVAGGEGSGYDRKDLASASVSGFNLPLTVPAGYHFNVTDMAFNNKYEKEEKYTRNFATMKLQTSVYSLSAHEPVLINLKPGILRYPRLGPSSGAHVFTALIDNNQVEEQNVTWFIAGYLCR